MLNKLLSIAKKFEIEVVFLNEVSSSGGYIPDANLIFVNANRNEKEIVRILAHEVSHAIKHEKEASLYIASSSSHSKMEYEAECDTIEFLIENYLSDDSIELDQINSIRIMNLYQIDHSYENIVKQSIYYFLANKKAEQYRKY